jgi:ATP-binding cassette subfamily B protein RaxB
MLNFSLTTKVPVILQTEAAECGLTCLAMVANYHGFETSLSNLRYKYSFSAKGANLLQVMKAASGMGFTHRAVRLETEELNNLKLPCILHWDLNHFVVLSKASGKSFIVHDPAKGEQKYSINQISQHFTGVALELTPSDKFEKKVENEKFKISQFWGKHKGMVTTLSQILAFSFALEVLAIISPMLSQLIVDEVLVSRDLNLMTVLGTGFLLLLVIQVVIDVVRSWVSLYLSTHLNLQVRNSLFRHLIRLPMSWFEKRHVGDIVSRFGSISTIQETLTGSLITGILDGVMVLATLAMMLIYNAELTLVVIALLFIYFFIKLVTFRRIRNINEERIIRSAKLQSHFLETIRSMQGIKLFAKEDMRHSLWHNLVTDNINADIKDAKFTFGLGAVNSLLMGSGNIIIYWMAAIHIIEGGFSIGMLFAFLAYKDQFSGKASGLINIFFALKMLSLHSERVADIALTETENSKEQVTGEFIVRGKVELENVGFRYSENEPWIFRNINLTIEAGESIALVGASGCGKTTLLKTMLGLLPLTEGKIVIDDVSLKVLGMENYRQQIAAVMQEDSLLSGSIQDNITFFDTNTEDSRVHACAKIACLHDDIMNMPMNYNTLVGDLGTTLSGGQKQRTLLARALYSNPRILFMDEATSHLDVDTEKRINSNIHHLKATRIIIAHRQETINTADRIFHL